MRGNNQEYREPITADEKREQYPEGYFASLVAQHNFKKEKVTGIALFLVLGILLNIWLIIAIVVYCSDPEAMTGALMLLLGGLALVHVFLCSLIVLVRNKRARRTREDWVKMAAKDSHLPESVVEDFEEQFRKGECWRLILDKKQGAIRVLTEDYYMVGTNAATLILRYEDIVGACFSYWDFSYSAGNRTRTSRSLVIRMFTRETETMVETAKEQGEGFLAFLKEKNPRVLVRNDGVLSEREYIKWHREETKKRE